MTNESVETGSKPLHRVCLHFQPDIFCLVFSCSDTRKQNQLHSVFPQVGLAGQQTGETGVFIRYHRGLYLTNAASDDGVCVVSPLRDPGGPSLHLGRESRGSQHHSESPHRIHHLSALQAWTQPQGEARSPDSAWVYSNIEASCDAFGFYCFLRDDASIKCLLL